MTADYIKSRFYDNNSEDEQISTFAIIGVIGGLLSLMVKIIKLLGKISLIIIYKQKKKTEENNSDNQNILISEDLNNEIVIE